jgi:hypothetical protein
MSKLNVVSMFLYGFILVLNMLLFTWIDYHVVCCFFYYKEKKLSEFSKKDSL